MLYRVNVKPTGDDVRNAVKLPNYEMIVETNMSSTQLRSMLGWVKHVDGCPARYITVNPVGKKARKHIKSGISIGEAVTIVDNTMFDVDIETTTVVMEPVGKIEDSAKAWKVWNSEHDGLPYHFFRYVGVDSMTDYENKMFRCHGTATISRAMYNEANIELHSGKDCLYFCSCKYYLKNIKDCIVVFKRKEVKTIETIKY